MFAPNWRRHTTQFEYFANNLQNYIHIFLYKKCAKNHQKIGVHVEHPFSTMCPHF